LLIARFCDHRDEAAFRQLYRQHSPLLYRVAFRMLGSDAAAQDSVQDTWTRAARALPQFRRQSKLSTWLVGIAINRCREMLRENRREQLQLVEDRRGSPAARSAAMQIDLERAISQLAPGYREVLVLHDVEGYTHEEIAEILSIDSGTSKSQLSRARGGLRKLLKP
jgi:RNA polymerase sigma-70 factor, ECF subfamily